MFRLVLVIAGLVSLAAASGAAQAPAAALTALVQAESREAAEAAARRIGNDVPFDEAWRRLREGRSYAPLRTGRVDLPSTDRGTRLDNVLDVPPDYVPTRQWPLRVSLHGGVGRPAPGPGDDPPRPLTNRIPSDGELVLQPRAFAGSEWWRPGQVDNVMRLIDGIRRRYNVDESHIYLTGISDGGTGTYYLAMRAATPWAACMPMNGHPSVLANPEVGADGQLYPGNMANCPWRIVNGGRDRLYPAASVEPLIAMFRRGGIPLDFQVYPEAGHDTSWWPQERPKHEAFLAAHPRAAHPARVSWETERVDRYNRFRWLVIERLGARPSDVALPDVKTFTPAQHVTVPLYDRDKTSGRVDAVRSGNRFDLKTRGVRALTLLLSPDAVDFSAPIVVTVNGATVHDKVVARDVVTLARWAARDNDRTMLYGAELRIAVP